MYADKSQENKNKPRKNQPHGSSSLCCDIKEFRKGFGFKVRP